MVWILRLALSKRKNLAGEQLGGLAAAPVNRFISSGAEYTPLETRCQQYIVVLPFLGAIECIFPQIYADLAADYFDVPVLDSNSS